MWGNMGAFGDIAFEVSSDKILTFNDLSRSGSGRWADHEIIGQKPVREFLGPGQEEITFTIRLSAFQGIDPGTELQKLRKMRDEGQTRGLVIGGKSKFNGVFWTLESIREQHKVYAKSGKLMVAEVELTLKEYPKLAKAVKK